MAIPSNEISYDSIDQDLSKISSVSLIKVDGNQGDFGEVEWFFMFN